MSTAGPGEEPGQHGRPQVNGAEQDDRSALPAWSDKQARMLADITQSIAAVETAGQVESDLAETLRAIAAQHGSEPADRRLRLAEDAERSAKAASERSERMRERASQWAEHADVAALRRALEYAATALENLAGAETRISGILTDLASPNGPELAAPRRQLAAQAAEAAQYARDVAQVLDDLAETSPPEAQPDGMPDVM